MIRWGDYLDDIRMFLPECPDVVIRGAVRDVAADFCEATFCWTDTISGIVVAVDDRDIALSFPDDNVEIVQPLWLGADGLDLTPKPQGWLDRNVTNWRYETGTPLYFTMPVKGAVVWLAPHTDTALTLDATVALKPGPNSVEGPDDLFVNYRIPIQAGVVSILALTPGKAWSNPKLAMANADAFNLGKAKALTHQSRGNAGARVRSTLNHRF
jgi:hypothetical protein